MVDHLAVDGLGLLNCVSLMQDEAARKSNPLPFPKREKYTAMQLVGKAGDWSARTEEYDKKFKETKVVGKGQ